jgi:hypothetical protein
MLPHRHGNPPQETISDTPVGAGRLTLSCGRNSRFVRNSSRSSQIVSKFMVSFVYLRNPSIKAGIAIGNKTN